METTLEKAATYDLRANPAWTVSLGILADEFVVEGMRWCVPFLKAYYAWDSRAGRGPSNTESMLEALTCGVLWNCYAEHTGGWEEAPRHQSGVEIIAHIPDGHVIAAFSHFISLLWLKGEFEEEVRRIGRFAKFFAGIDESAMRDYLTAMARFAEWFQVRAQEILGDVTQQVDEFRMHAAMHDEYRDDAPLRDRREVEYHLNLLTAVILNCAWRDRFEHAEKKLLVLPGCMRPQKGAHCQGHATKLGITCTGCSNACAVHRAQQVAAGHGIPTVVLEHQSAVFAQEQAEAIRAEGYAVIGVACALSLQAGGWKADDAGIPAQCLPLTYAGCARHWSEGHDMQTDIDSGLLTEIITGTNIAPNWR